MLALAKSGFCYRTIGRGVEDDFDRTGDFEVAFEGGAGEAEDVGPHLDVTLIVWSPGNDVRRAAVVAADRLNRERREVGEVVGWLGGRLDN